MDSRALGASETPVAAEVEVIFFNLSKKRGLVLGALAEGVDGRRALLRGPMTPGEHPATAARRLLETVAGVPTALHEPELVAARVAAHRQSEGPTLTLSYAVLGSVPSNSHETWSCSESVDDLESPLDDRVDDAAAVRAARLVIARLLEEVPLAPALVPPPAKQFTLADLDWVYSCVIGPTWRTDFPNFRRKIERIEGLVERVAAPETAQHIQAKRGRPPIWYKPGSAVIDRAASGRERQADALE